MLKHGPSHLRRILIACSVASILGGCAPLLVGGAAAGASVANDKRSVGSVVNDTLIKLRIEALIRAHRHLRYQTHIDVTSVNGLVLLTGEARSVQTRDGVLAIARTIHGVRKIINQIRIAPPSSFAMRLDDSWITTRVKLSLIAHGLDANRIKVVTADRVVYLMGLVRHTHGAAAAVVASRIPQVRSVVELFEYQK